MTMTAINKPSAASLPRPLIQLERFNRLASIIVYPCIFSYEEMQFVGAQFAIRDEASAKPNYLNSGLFIVTAVAPALPQNQR